MSVETLDTSWPSDLKLRFEDHLQRPQILGQV